MFCAPWMAALSRYHFAGPGVGIEAEVLSKDYGASIAGVLGKVIAEPVHCTLIVFIVGRVALLVLVEPAKTPTLTMCRRPQSHE